jgi:nicotinate-nucleotide pyrophosphorylase (carboxylating)
MQNVMTYRFGPEEISVCLRLVQAGLAEDLGQVGDVTSAAMVSEHQQGAARFVARQSGVLAGLEAARILLTRLDGTLIWEWGVRDGAQIEPGSMLARVSGRLRSLLAGERVALNFVQHLSAVATQTRRYVETIAGFDCRIYDTRKTTPGWRVLEKYAVRVGGGFNHRMGLYDAVLIKDNHLVAWRFRAAGLSLADAVRAARNAVPEGTVVEMEVDSLAQLEEALPGEPDIVLLDNMELEQLRKAVMIRNRNAPRLLLEASGGITLPIVRQIAETGVDRISIGAITHSAPALDIAFDFEEPAR